mmetsp:Transcript_2444/g.3934  ORF Transcript_2444/g.3934 Transcript_2444/m.3934 type:complete len:141 (+) Transcript_2444:854-1276(+)
MEEKHQIGLPHGAKAAEVYGIVGYLFSLMFFVLYLLWAYTPDWILHSMSITYYPDRYWSIAWPSYLCMLVAYFVVIYISWNIINTNPYDSYYTVRDTIKEAIQSKEKDLRFKDKSSIPEAADMSIHEVNSVLFCSHRERT